MNDLSRLKVCFLAGTLTPGGAERQLYYMLRALARAGATARVLSLDRGEFWEEKIKDLGVRVTWLGERSSRLPRLFRLLKEMQMDPPDVLQSQHFYTNAYVGMAARLLPMSGVGAMRSDGRLDARKSGSLGAWLNLRLPAIIAANSQSAIQYALAQGVAASRLHFLPNVVDTERFRISEDSEQKAEGRGRNAGKPITLIAVGRLVRLKRLDRFISILGRLRTDCGLNVRGLIVGSRGRNQDLQPELENQARSLGLSPDVVQFRSVVSDMQSVYHEAAVCVLTSDFEGTPNVLLEAMACGLPVVAARTGGVPGIVQHGRTGFLLEPDDLDGFVAALAGLVRNLRLGTEMGRQARAYVEQNHSLERLPACLSALYQMALPQRRLSPAPVFQSRPAS